MRPVLPSHIFLDVKTGAQLLRVPNLTETVYWPGNPVMLVTDKTHEVLQGVVHSVEGEIVRIEVRTPRARAVPTAERFMHRGLSIRRTRINGRTGYCVWAKGQRSFGSYSAPLARLRPSSDGSCWMMSGRNMRDDARTGFWAALDLAIDRISQA